LTVEPAADLLLALRVPEEVMMSAVKAPEEWKPEPIPNRH
jgi:hypothetical protein